MITFRALIYVLVLLASSTGGQVAGPDERDLGYQWKGKQGKWWKHSGMGKRKWSMNKGNAANTKPRWKYRGAATTKHNTDKKGKYKRSNGIFVNSSPWPKGKGVPSSVFPRNPTPQPPPPAVSCSPSTIAVRQLQFVVAEPVLDDTPGRVLRAIDVGETDVVVTQAEFGTAIVAIQCVTDIPDVAGSSILTATTPNGLGDTTKIDNAEPFILADETDFVYSPTNLFLSSEWTVTCQPFCGPDGTGDTSGSVTFDFEFQFVATP